MKLRKLEEKDAKYMLEWMHDEDVVKNMQANFQAKTLDDCLNFIKNSRSLKNVHVAIVNEKDEYMGTVSLKNIEQDRHIAEFAITIRKCAMGQGYSAFAMKEIIEKGFERFGINDIYWYVDKKNIRAIKFYEKMGYAHWSLEKLKRIGLDEQKIDTKSMIWYGVSKENCKKGD